MPVRTASTFLVIAATLLFCPCAMAQSPAAPAPQPPPMPPVELDQTVVNFGNNFDSTAGMVARGGSKHDVYMGFNLSRKF